MSKIIGITLIVGGIINLLYTAKEKANLKGFGIYFFIRQVAGGIAAIVLGIILIYNL